MPFFVMTGQSAGAGSGNLLSPPGGVLHVSNGIPVNLIASTNPGSTFGGWSCVGATFSYSTANATGDSFAMPSENVTCTATFNLAAPPPVAASVESNIALILTFLGIAAIVGFKKWRSQNAGY